MPRNRTLAALLGLCAGLAACEDTSTAPELAPADAANPQAAALRWSTTRLSIGNGLATDVNNQGQVVGYHSTNQGTRAFLWSNGTLQNLGTLGGGDSRAFAINETGQVVGQSTRADGPWHAFLWQNGTMQDLGALNADVSVATDIDNQGRVVGYTEVIGAQTRAFLWQNGQMKRPGNLIGYSTANAIDSKGRIVGAFGARLSPRAYRWEGGHDHGPRHTQRIERRGRPRHRRRQDRRLVDHTHGRAACLSLGKRFHDRPGDARQRQQQREWYQRLWPDRRLEPAAGQPTARVHLEGRRHVRHRGRRGHGHQ